MLLISEVLIVKVELSRVLSSGASLFDSSLLIVTDSLFKEVGLALEGDHVHPFEGVLDIISLGDSESE